MKILVIEDEPKAAEYLRQGLIESGYTVEVAHNGTDGLHAAATGDHDAGLDGGWCWSGRLSLTRGDPERGIQSRSN